MTCSLVKRFVVLSACFGFWPILLVAQSSDATQNLADCKNGWESCDRSKLSQSEFADVAMPNTAETFRTAETVFNPAIVRN